MTRRSVLVTASCVVAGCAAPEGNSQSLQTDLSRAAKRGRLSVQFEHNPSSSLAEGVHRIPVPGSRSAILYAPRDTDTPVPLIVSLHGAGGTAEHGLDLFRASAERDHFAVLAVASRNTTWDVIGDGYGPDVLALNQTLAFVLDHLRISRNATAIGGFSDGASYALSIGLANGDIFPQIIAFSPGFMAPGTTHDKPRVFVSHGTKDAVLPIDSCSRRLVKRLKATGYLVEYREFDGPHTVPEQIRKDALEWWLKAGTQSGAQ